MKLIFVFVLVFAAFATGHDAKAIDVFHRMEMPLGGGYVVVAAETHDYLVEQFGQWKILGFYEVRQSTHVEWAMHSAIRSDDSVQVECRIRRVGGDSLRQITSFTCSGSEGPVSSVVVENDSLSQMSLIIGDSSQYKGKRFSFFVFKTIEEAKDAIRVVSFQPGWSWRAKVLP